jgi:hypothetical protein
MVFLRKKCSSGGRRKLEIRLCCGADENTHKNYIKSRQQECLCMRNITIIKSYICETTSEFVSIKFDLCCQQRQS